MRRPDTYRALLAFAFANGVADAAFLPMLPAIRADLALTQVETGALLAATTLAMLLTAVPLGLLASRVGARRLLLVAAALMPLSLAAQGFAGGLEPLVAARVGFGVSFGILWVVGPALAAGSGRGASGTGPLIAVSGAGWLVGPVAAGILVDLGGWRLTCVVLAVLALPLAALFAGREVAAADEPAAAVRIRSALALVRRDRTVAGAALVCALLGVVTGVTSLLAPLVLSANGLSASAIGLAFGVSASVWIVSATLIGRLRARSVDLRSVGIGVAVLGIAWLLPVASLSTAAVIGFLVVSAACRSSINALVYAVGARAGGGESAAAVLGVLNLAWAAAALLAPLAAGAADGDAGIRLAFAFTAVAAVAVAAVVLVPRRQLAIGVRPS